MSFKTIGFLKYSLGPIFCVSDNLDLISFIPSGPETDDDDDDDDDDDAAAKR